MIIAYFAGLNWLNRGRIPADTSTVVRTFVNRYGVNYAHDGGMAIACDRRSPVLIRGPVAWITRPGHFSYGAIGGGAWSNRHINFTGPRCQAFIRGGLLDPGDPIIPVYQPEQVRAAFDALFDQLEGERYDQPLMVHLLESLLLLLHSQREATVVPAGRTDAIMALCRRLRDRPHAAVDLAHEAAGLGVSLPTFRRLFTTVVGLPPHRYLLRARMDRAATLLTETHLPIRAIAAEVGMSDQYQFAKCFRRHHMMTPSAWRSEGSTSTTGLKAAPIRRHPTAR